MRITSTMFTNTFLQQANTLQQNENNTESEIASGMSITNPGDDPTAFGQVGLLREDNSQTAEYSSITNTLTTAAQSSYNGMTQLQSIMTDVGSIMAEATNGTTGYQEYGQQLESYATQIAQIANTQVNGVYIYGSSGNQPPLVALSSPTANGPQYELNTTTAGYTSAVTTATINSNLTVSIGLTAGSNTSGASSFGGFLTDGTTTDLYTMVASAAADLLNATSSTGDPFSGDANLGGSYSTAVSQITTAGDRVSEYVGRASSQLALLESNSSSLSTTATSQTNEISTLSTADTATAATELTQIQTAYEAALESGSKILSLNMLDYLST